MIAGDNPYFDDKLQVTLADDLRRQHTHRSMQYVTTRSMTDLNEVNGHAGQQKNG